MKNYILTGLLVLGLLTLDACKQVLDTEPLDRISEDVVWQTKANAETFIFSTYNIMNSFATGQGGDPRSGNTDTRTTNILGSYDSYNAGAPFFNDRITRNDDYGGFNNWASVRRCNLIIEKVNASPGISEADKATLTAEAKFLRAMSYYSVARSIGRIVWIDKVLSPDDDMFLPATANPTESYNYIIKDLEDAVAGLPATKVAGRANKYTAAAFLTEVCLQALAYKNYPAASAVSATDPLLDKVIANAKLVISGGYSMESDYGGMFNNVKSNSPEIIFGIYRKAVNTNVDNTPMQTIIPNLNNNYIAQNNGSPKFSNANIFEAWGNNFPSQNIADEYLVIDRANPSVALAWNKTSQYKNAVEEGARIPSTVIPKAVDETVIQSGTIKPGSSETIWSLTNEGRDARWHATILSDSSETFYGEILTTTIQGNSNRWMEKNGYTWSAGFANMYWRKGVYTNVNPRVYVGVPTDYHYVPMRLGRVYLNLAEAYLLKGDLADAIESLNQTRVNHGKLPAVTAAGLQQAWTDYKRERRVDLVMENDYYYSLLRWGRYGGNANSGIASGGTIPELTTPPYAMDVSKDRKSFMIVKGPFGYTHDIRLFDASKSYLLPIAQSFLDRNPNLAPQNPGW
ncbi:RagB/SusD family nutrient uptake outer membrane protein [Dyadobacter bucti]|uniref:RagB/SusD family nutrient uptake outer membrane protein n=1 Tax=Dyadobacter bucti TaxID=2572203 RepID=UPI003F714CDC